MLRDLEVIIEKKKIPEALGAVPCCSKKGKQDNGLYQQRSKPKSKGVLLLLYGLILSYKELVGVNQTPHGRLITLSSESPLSSWTRGSSQSAGEDAGFLLHIYSTLGVQCKIM